MVFSSIEFLYLYLPLASFIYFIIPAKYLSLRNLALLVLSLVFYGWGEPVYIFIMFFSIAVDYICGYLVAKNREANPKKAKIAMIASVVLNLSVLGFFKYFDFIIENLALIPIFPSLKPLGIALPIGISFYTFQTMSYTLDIYLGKAKVQKNIFSFGSYVTMFPQLIAGPIVRYGDVDEQLRYRKHSFEKASSGILRFICGLAKKVLLANTAGAVYSQLALSASETPSMLSSWLALIFFSFQIYFDFSGYSDMAIGLGRIMGFEFNENFDYPYISKSITEFWRRWHISLSSWFKEYVYIPLGGNRKGLGRTVINLLIVWFLTGLWHGASWNFIIWGLYFFLLLVIEKFFLLKVLQKLPKFISHIYSLLFVVFGWYIFIACDLTAPFEFLKAMFTAPIASDLSLYELLRNIAFIVVLCVAATPLPNKVYSKIKDKAIAKVIIFIAAITLLLICTAYIVDSSYNPFLYFRF